MDTDAPPQVIEQIVQDDESESDLVTALSILNLAEGLFDKEVEPRYYVFDIPNDQRIEWRHRNNPEEARRFGKLLLSLPEEKFYYLFRMIKSTFYSLCVWLKTNTSLCNSRYQSVEFKVMVFLWICAFNEPQRNTAYRFKISQPGVSRIFHKVIDPMRLLYTAFVKQLGPTYLSSDVELQEKFMQFNGAIGAIDGTYIPAFIPLARQKRFWSRKNNISQNVLAAVSFNGLFTYVLAGGEGSVYNSTLLAQATSRSLQIPPNRFLLADAGFGLR